MNANQLFESVNPSVVIELFTWLRENERDLYKNAIINLASNKKLRPVFVTKKPVPDQIAWLHKTLKSNTSNVIGEHLLQIWFMQAKQDMLITFCDSLEIAHDGNGTVEEDLPEELDSAGLKKAADALLASHPANITTLYLQVFNMQRQGGWQALTELLASDDRLQLGS